ncbi:MAG: folylpolyglutamate synthase/dihydrofolate synthase family protein [Acidobacteriota bacterium]
MNFPQSVSYLNGLGNEILSMKLGLDSMRRLASELGDPQKEVPAVHIAGTNGKGSTAAMTAAIVERAGLKVGLYTSPHLIDIRERIKVGALNIAEEDFARLASEVSLAGQRLVSRGELPALPTFFEQVTMIGFLYFLERRVKLAVLEVGLGGRLDATNICRPLVIGLTPIAKDHEKYLGDTISAIASEKAGIIKEGVPVVSASQPPEALRVIKDRCAELGSDLTLVEESTSETSARREGFFNLHLETSAGSYDVRLNLRGRHQVGNAATAIHLVEKLAEHGLPIETSAIVSGIESVSWPGRLEILKTRSGRDLLLDGAHNPDGARSLRRFLEEEYADRAVTLIFSAMSDKALEEMTQTLFPIVQTVIATRIGNPRAVEPAVIARQELRIGRRVLTAETSVEAMALAETETSVTGIICAAGSLYLIGELRAQLLSSSGER